MKPKPFSALNHFTVPCAMGITLSLLANGARTSRAPGCRTTPTTVGTCPCDEKSPLVLRALLRPARNCNCNRASRYHLRAVRQGGPGRLLQSPLPNLAARRRRRSAALPSSDGRATCRAGSGVGGGFRPERPLAPRPPHAGRIAAAPGGPEVMAAPRPPDPCTPYVACGSAVLDGLDE